MDDREPRERPRRRLSLRGMMALVVVVALGLATILPIYSEQLRRFERYVRVKLNHDDLNRHIDVAAILRLVEGFSGAVRSGRPGEALGMTTAAFRGRTTPDQLRALAAGVGLDLGPCELVEATCAFPEGGYRFVSEYQLRCGPATGPNRMVKLVVVTEAAWLRVDRIEAGSK